ncbi:hypothetical protein [Paraburkholderia tropica]|uniref:hypothetical protein n=1 Tax=Paraburkholderia tropica TaxID=92647 RepID=UPI0007EE1373|nr:hypothetical protein [Paraburkholderia tropica]OBR46981.1 hypothetical protein A6456_37835 [Paraburkholderia tropica]
MEFEHALIIGGTGMLNSASRYLSKHASHVTLVSRDGDAARQRLSFPHANYISADWTMPAVFIDRLKPALALRPVDLILLWMHRSGREARLSLLNAVRGSNSRIIDVHGSGAADVMERIAQRRLEVSQAGCRYNAVLLGSLLGDNQSPRWLTHDEISRAVIEAVQTESDVVAGNV